MPKCNGLLVARNSARGAFLGCRNYPQCNYTQQLISRA
ncbi:topoisomerase DNA-binding C4 zinc finger domain-containing protein [Pedobacter aquatilis]